MSYRRTLNWTYRDPLETMRPWGQIEAHLVRHMVSATTLQADSTNGPSPNAARTRFVFVTLQLHHHVESLSIVMTELDAPWVVYILRKLSAFVDGTRDPRREAYRMSVGWPTLLLGIPITSETPRQSVSDVSREEEVSREEWQLGLRIPWPWHTARRQSIAYLASKLID